jgi:hypothetical protein
LKSFRKSGYGFDMVFLLLTSGADVDVVCRIGVGDCGAVDREDKKEWWQGEKESRCRFTFVFFY